MSNYRPHPSLVGAGSGGGGTSPPYNDAPIKTRLLAVEENDGRQDDNIVLAQNDLGALRVDLDQIVETGGLQGPKGDKGDTGAQGIQGPRGLQGVQGVQGVQGDIGPRGPAGADGPQGVQGPQGPSGQAGSQGERGLTGDRGVDGAAGPAGPRGADGSNLRILGTVPTPADLPATGEHGDGWTVGTVLYTWSGSAWTAVADLRGPQGPDGPRGLPGDVGPAGARGDPGERGEKGETGNLVVMAPHGGARVFHAGVQNYAILSTWDSFKWDTSDRDTGGFWTASAPSRLTIPAGVSKVRLVAAVTISSTNKAGANLFQLRKNGMVVTGLGTTSIDYGSTYSNLGTILVSGVIDVVPGDYFELLYFAAESFDVAGVSTWFEIQVAERAADSVAVSYRTTDLQDVDATTPFADGDVLVYDAATKKLRPAKPTFASVVKRPFKGALVGFAENRVLSQASQAWSAVEYDTDGFWSATASTKLVIPSGKGIRLVRLFAMFVPETAWDGDMHAYFRKNQAVVKGLPQVTVGRNTGFQAGGISLVSAPIKVADQDQLDVLFYCNNSTSRRVSATSSFGLEVLAYADEIA